MSPVRKSTSKRRPEVPHCPWLTRNRARHVISSSDEVKVTAPQFKEGDSPAGESQSDSESHTGSCSRFTSASFSNADSKGDAQDPPSTRVETVPSTTELNR